MATAVRKDDNSIEIESSRFTPLSEKSKFFRLPIIRGCVSFCSSLVTGMKTIIRAGEAVGAVDEEPTKFEAWLAKKFNADLMSIAVVIAVILGIAFSIGLFVVIPQLIATGIFAVAKLSAKGFGMSVVYNLIAGFSRMLIFIGYLALVTLSKDIKRLFRYHGAEHKVISCYENELELTVENVRKMPTEHDRCGTTFTFLVMLISILFFAAFPVEILANGGTAVNLILRILSRIIMIPIVAGVSYEILKLLSKSDNKIARFFKKPGLWLQKLTTKEPDDSMIEVSLAAFNEVLLLEADPNFAVKKFDTAITVDKAKRRLFSVLNDDAENELILCFVTGAKTKSELCDGREITSEQYRSALKYASIRSKGAPLQYILGVACFYGLDFTVRSGVLIPRADTERLAETVVTKAKTLNNPSILDMCTGSGAVAVAVKKNAECTVIATDISEDALTVARENAQRLKADVTFKRGSLFAPVKGERFDIISANPPYIPTGDLKTLDKSVIEYEPRLALDGGEDGLDFYRDIIAKAKDYLKPNGYLVFEVGANQADKVKAMLEGYEVETVCDYNNPPIERVVCARLK